MEAEKRVRLDARLVALGLASGREKAKECIAAGLVEVNGKPVTKPSFLVAETDEIVSRAEPPRFVGRGGYKLEKALDDGRISVAGAIALDVGASTGGFTQCLLQHGALRVYAVDVGRDQLHTDLRADSRVVSLEKTDIRDYRTVVSHIPERSIDFACIDVSFISLKLILPAILPFLKEGAAVVALIKPQFEAGRQALDKRGVVRHAADHRRVLHELVPFAATHSLAPQSLSVSPVRGGDGNCEFLLSMRYQPGAPLSAVSPQEIDRVVESAHAAG